MGRDDEKPSKKSDSLVGGFMKKTQGFLKSAFQGDKAGGGAAAGTGSGAAGASTADPDTDSGTGAASSADSATAGTVAQAEEKSASGDKPQKGGLLGGKLPGLGGGKDKDKDKDKGKASASAETLEDWAGLQEVIDEKVQTQVYQEQSESAYTGEKPLAKSSIPPGTYATKAGDTFLSIAEQHLGPKSKKPDREAYAREIQLINGLPPGKELPPSLPLVLPGHTRDGGFVIADGAKTITKFPSGVKVFENEDDQRKGTQTPGTDGSYTEEHTGPGAADNYFVSKNAEGEFQYSEKSASEPYQLIQDEAVQAAHQKLRDLADRHIVEQAEKTKFNVDMARFEDRATKRNLANAAVIETYKQISRLLEAPVPGFGDRGLRAPVNKRLQLAQELLAQSAEPKTVCQGTFSRGSLAAIEHHVYLADPAKICRLVVDIALTGKFTATDGTSHTMSPESLEPQSQPNTVEDGLRSFATQLFQVAIANLAHESVGLRNTPQTQEGADKKYSIEPLDRLLEQDNGERLYDKVNGKWELTGESPGLDDDKTIGCYLLVMARGGETYKAVNSTAEMMKWLPGRTGVGVMIGHEDHIFGFGKLLDTISSERDLMYKISDISKSNRLPVFIRVHTGNEPFLSESGNQTAGGAGNWHVLAITSYEPSADGKPASVTIDNPWRARAEQRSATLTLPELHKSTTLPERVEPVSGSAVSNLGAIESFTVPEGWNLGRRSERAYGYIYAWQPQAQTNVSLNISYRGRPLSDADAAKLKSTLSGGPRTLSSHEVHALSGTVRELASSSAFTINSAKVIDVDGVAALEVTGAYKDQYVDKHALFINADGAGRIVQEISYIAPRDKYANFVATAKSALASLKLKK